MTPIKNRVGLRTMSPVMVKNDHFVKKERIILTGSPLSMARRNYTPGMVRSKHKRLVTKLPFVKWVN